MPRIGIALYELRDPNRPELMYWHWALVVCDEDQWTSNPVWTFDLDNRRDGPGFVLRYKHVSLLNSSQLRGVVDLGNLGEFKGVAIGEIRRRGPEGPINHPVPGRGRWTCAAWVLDILYDLDQMGVIDLGIPLSTVYDTVGQLGYHLQAMFGTITPFPVVRLCAPRHR